jgi:hypothetical protein
MTSCTTRPRPESPLPTLQSEGTQVFLRRTPSRIQDKARGIVRANGMTLTWMTSEKAFLSTGRFPHYPWISGYQSCCILTPLCSMTCEKQFLPCDDHNFYCSERHIFNRSRTSDSMLITILRCRKVDHNSSNFDTALSTNYSTIFLSVPIHSASETRDIIPRATPSRNRTA